MYLGAKRRYINTLSFLSFPFLSRVGSVTARHSTLVAGVSQLCGVEQRAPPIFGRAAITLGIGPHSSFILFEYRDTDI